VAVVAMMKEQEGQLLLQLKGGQTMARRALQGVIYLRKFMGSVALLNSSRKNRSSNSNNPLS
jgi:hypothetical protein